MPLSGLRILDLWSWISGAIPPGSSLQAVLVAWFILQTATFIKWYYIESKPVGSQIYLDFNGGEINIEFGHIALVQIRIIAARK